MPVDLVSLALWYNTLPIVTDPNTTRPLLPVNLDHVRNVGHALFKAIAHIGAVNPEASSEVVDMLCDHLAELRSALHGGNAEDMGKLTACMRRCIGDPDR